MKYQDPKFSSRPASKEYRDGWERTFRPLSPAESYWRIHDHFHPDGCGVRSCRKCAKPKKPRRRG